MWVHRPVLGKFETQYWTEDTRGEVVLHATPGVYLFSLVPKRGPVRFRIVLVERALSREM